MHPGLWLLLVTLCLTEELAGAGEKSYGKPCGGQDCRRSCQCFPEKGARHNLQLLNDMAGRLYHFSEVLPNLF
uniref:Collagen type IV alpha 6 chain n=1 Tax=Pongo abelii TaxID=9601 RepID=A0A8I5TGG8_PONAB